MRQDHLDVPDSPHLAPDQCRVSHVNTIGNGLDHATQRHCCAPVVNPTWQLCAKHQGDRERLM